MLAYAGAGMAIDSRDWGVVSVLPHSLAEKSGLTAGSIVLKVNGLKTKNPRLTKKKLEASNTSSCGEHRPGLVASGLIHY